MTGLPEKLAASGGASLLGSLIGPKVERLAEWAREEDLKQKASGVHFEIVFEEYFESLRARVGVMRTIVFPTLDIELPRLYEPLTLDVITEDSRTCLEAVTAADIVGQRLIVRDRAGMGKSTLLRYLALTALADERLIPVFLELRRIPESGSLLSSILDQFDLPGLQRDQDLLLRLLHLGDFVLLLDGFDELSRARRDDIGGELQDLVSKAAANSFLVTTRPEAGSEMLIGFESAEIRPFGRSASVSLLRRYDVVADASHADQVIPLLDDVPSEFIENPLLLSLIYRTQATGGDVTGNISTFYEDVYSALFRGHDLIKATFHREKECGLDTDDFRSMLRAFCFHLALSSKYSFASESEAVGFIDKARLRVQCGEFGSSAFLADLLLAVPFLVRDAGEIRFIHRSFIDFFAAEFVAFDTRALDLAADLRRSELYPHFHASLRYLAEISPEVYHAGFVCPVAKRFLDVLASLPDVVAHERIASLFVTSAKVAYWIGPESAPEIVALMGVRRSQEPEEWEACRAALRAVTGFAPVGWGIATLGSGEWLSHVDGGAEGPAIPFAVARLIGSAAVEARFELEVPKELEREQWVTFDVESVASLFERWAPILLASGYARAERTSWVFEVRRAKAILAVCGQDEERHNALSKLLGSDGPLGH